MQGTDAFRRLLRRGAPQGRMKKRFGPANLGYDDSNRISSTSFGRNFRITGPIMICSSSSGGHCYAESGCRIGFTDIGRFSAAGPGCFIGMAEPALAPSFSIHPLFWLNRPTPGYALADRDDQGEYGRTRIGNDGCIGAGVDIRSGVTVGDGAVADSGA